MCARHLAAQASLAASKPLPPLLLTLLLLLLVILLVAMGMKPLFAQACLEPLLLLLRVPVVYPLQPLLLPPVSVMYQWQPLCLLVAVPVSVEAAACDC